MGKAGSTKISLWYAFTVLVYTMGSMYVLQDAFIQVPIHSYKHVHYKDLCLTYFISSLCSSVGESATTSGNSFLINWSPHKSLLDI